MISLEDWIDTMVLAENLVKVRHNGLVYIDPNRLDAARAFAAQVGVDMDDWIDRYFDYDHYV